MHVIAEDIDDLAQRVAQTIMKPRTEHDDSQTDLRSRQGVGDRWLDFLAAFGTPVAMDRMFGNFRLCLGNILDVSHPRFVAPIELRSAIGTSICEIGLLPVDSLGNLSGRSGMPLLCSRFLPALFWWRLLIRRDHRRRSRWRYIGSSFASTLGEFQQRKHDRIFTLRKDRLRLLGTDERSISQLATTSAIMANLTILRFQERSTSEC